MVRFNVFQHKYLWPDIINDDAAFEVDKNPILNIRYSTITFHKDDGNYHIRIAVTLKSKIIETLPNDIDIEDFFKGCLFFLQLQKSQPDDWEDLEELVVWKWLNISAFVQGEIKSALTSVIGNDINDAFNSGTFFMWKIVPWNPPRTSFYTLHIFVSVQRAEVYHLYRHPCKHADIRSL
jgi:hypothetical protein